MHFFKLDLTVMENSSQLRHVKMIIVTFYQKNSVIAQKKCNPNLEILKVICLNGAKTRIFSKYSQ